MLSVAVVVVVVVAVVVVVGLVVVVQAYQKQLLAAHSFRVVLVAESRYFVCQWNLA